MWWLVGVAVAADIICPERPTEAIVAAADRVLSTWLGLDEAGFAGASHETRTLAPCVDRVLTVDMAARIHVARGVMAFVEDDVESSRRAFAAVHALNPNWTLPIDLLPPDHPLLMIVGSAFEAASRPPIPIAVVPVHGWAVDGARFPRPEDPQGRGSYGLPTHRAFVLQVLGERGDVVYTGYHYATVDLPVGQMVVASDALLVRRKRAEVARTVGTAVAGSLLAGGAVALGLGLDARQDITTADPARVDELVTRSNILGGTAVALGLAGATLMTVTWVVRW